MKTTFKKLIKEINPHSQYIYSDFVDQKEEVTDTKLEFVKLDKVLSNEEVFELCEKKGLRPATFIELASAVKNDNTLFDKYIFTLRDKNEFAYFIRDGVGQYVCVDRDGSDWSDRWWFCGKKKEAFNKPQPALVEGEKELIPWKICHWN